MLGVLIWGYDGRMIIHCGEALIDFLPSTDTGGRQLFGPRPGGSPYNTAIAVARLGVPSAFLGRVSTDFFGDQLVEGLRTNGVSTQFLARGPEPSTLAFVRRQSDGSARYAFFADGAADRSLNARNLPTVLSDSVAALQFGSISLLADPAASAILHLVEREGAQRVVSFDPNVREHLMADPDAGRRDALEHAALATIVKLSVEDLDWLLAGASDTGGDVAEAAQSLLTGRTKLVVVTLGDAGALAVFGNQVVEVSVHPTTVVDTIGAGDSFHGALLAYLYGARRLSLAGVDDLDTGTVREALSFAAKAAAITCGRAGADPPYRSELP